MHAIMEKLKEQGLKIWIHHIRTTELHRGGITYVRITPSDKPRDTLAAGYAFCSDKDNFNKKRGVSIALGRAYCEFTGEAERRRKRKETWELEHAV